MTNPEAIFDTLYIAKKLHVKMSDFSMSEVQFFSYLSCLLSLYNGGNIESWKYTFIKSDIGSPYSADIHIAFDTLIANGSFAENGEVKGYYITSEKGMQSLAFYETLSSFSQRKQYLNAACNCISIIPFGIIKEAMRFEPVLSSANNSLSKRSLLEQSNPATKSLYVQFASLKAALNDQYKDLMIPAVVWIDSLTKNENAF